MLKNNEMYHISGINNVLDFCSLSGNSILKQLEINDTRIKGFVNIDNLDLFYIIYKHDNELNCIYSINNTPIEMMYNSDLNHTDLLSDVY